MLSQNGRRMRKDTGFAPMLQDDSSGHRSLPQELACSDFSTRSGHDSYPAGQ